MSDEDKGQICWLVCKPCEQTNEKDFGFKLIGRSRIGWFSQLAPTGQLDKWLMKHGKCGGRGHPDHFVLAMSFPADHDQPKPKPIVQAVESALG